MLKIFIFLLAITFACAKHGVNIGGYVVSRNEANCLGQSSRLVAMDIINEYGNLNRNFGQNFLYLLDGGVSEVDGIIRVKDSFDPASICSLTAQSLPHSFNGTIWLSVESRLWSQEISNRLSYLEQFIKTCQSRGVRVGVYSNLAGWTMTFGYPTACSEVLRTVPQWYYSNNGNQNFNDFGYASFGRWPKPTMKEFIGAGYLCNFYVQGQEYYE